MGWARQVACLAQRFLIWCKVIMEISAEKCGIIKQLMSASAAFFLTFLVVSSSQIINLGSPSSPAGDSGNVTFTDQWFNLSTLDASQQQHIDDCVSLLNESTIFTTDFTVGAAFERDYSDGYREYYLYLDAADTNDNYHELLAIVAFQSSDSSYVLQQVSELPLNNTGLESNNSVPVTQEVFTSKTQPASSLDQLYAAIAKGFTQVDLTASASDAGLAGLQMHLSTDYAAIAQSTVAAVFSKAAGLATEYVLFYKNGGSVYSALAVVDNIRKIHFIISVNKVDTSGVSGN